MRISHEIPPEKPMAPDPDQARGGDFGHDGPRRHPFRAAKQQGAPCHAELAELDAVKMRCQEHMSPVPPSQLGDAIKTIRPLASVNTTAYGVNVAGLREELQAEYLLLQNQYEAYDQRALSLKALATPLLGAGVAEFKQPSVVLIGLTVAVAAALWVLETTWKVFQYCNIPRIRALEEWFASLSPGDLKPFQVYRSLTAAFKGEGRDAHRWLFVALEPFVFLPYAVVVVAGITAAVLVPPRL